MNPWKTTVNSNANNYVFTATATGIFGPGSLEKFGSSTLTLSGSNFYSGQTIVGGGVLSTSTATGLGDGSATNSIAISGGGRLSFTAAAAHDLGVNRNIAIGAGGGSISRNSATAATQTLAALNIGDGGVVNFGDLPPPSLADAPEAFAPDALGGDFAGGSTQAVPEPGSVALLLGDIATLLGIRRRRE